MDRKSGVPSPPLAGDGDELMPITREGLSLTKINIVGRSKSLIAL